MIQPASPELVELARTMRGDQWADDLTAALVAAHNAGWTWPRTLTFTARLLVDEEARPHDLAVAARGPFDHVAGSEPTPEYLAAKAALEET